MLPALMYPAAATPVLNRTVASFCSTTAHALYMRINQEAVPWGFVLPTVAVVIPIPFGRLSILPAKNGRNATNKYAGLECAAAAGLTSPRRKFLFFGLGIELTALKYGIVLEKVGDGRLAMLACTTNSACSSQYSLRLCGSINRNDKRR
jgi:hypothetical protein